MMYLFKLEFQESLRTNRERSVWKRRLFADPNSSLKTSGWPGYSLPAVRKLQRPMKETTLPSTPVPLFHSNLALVTRDVQ